MAAQPMIALDSVSKTFGRWKDTTTVLDGVSVAFEPRKHYVIFGQAGAGKSTLLRLLCGLQWPTSGSIQRDSVVAPPLGSMAVLGLANTVHGVVTFCANLYRTDPSELMNFVVEFAELHDFVDTPIAALPALERVALSYAIGYGIPADFYLIDGTPVGGSESVRRRCQAAFEERRAKAATILTTRNLHNFKPRGEQAAILHEGSLVTYRHMQEAVDVYCKIEMSFRHGTLSAAEFMTRQGDLSGAVGYLEDYVSINADDLSGHRMLANVALRAQNFAAAKEALQAVVELAPDDKEAFLALARAAERDADWATAASCLTQYLKSEPGNPLIYASLARCYEKLGQTGDAAKLWHRVFAMSDNLADATAAIRACIWLQDWNAVFRMLDHALEQWPRDLPLLTMAAKVCLQLARPADFVDTLLRMAEVDFDKAVARACGAVAQLKWNNIADFLNGARALGDVSAEATKRLVGQMERQARLADKDNRGEEATNIRACLQTFKADV